MDKRLDVSNITDSYVVKIIGEDDLDLVYEMCRKNANYYEFCPPFVTMDSLKKDLEAVPPNKLLDDKYYFGFYDRENDLVAVVDLIVNYPRDNCCYIGFFMVSIDVQNKGVGSYIIDLLCKYLLNAGFLEIELAYVENNVQARNFWLKNGFLPITSKKQELFNVVCMNKKLK